MIKIKRLSAPKELTDEVKKQLTTEFKTGKNKRVWNKPYIRKRLLEMSLHKCCYCEELLGPGHVEMHVEHYHDKSKCPDEVVEWDNLLPSCPYCNKKKSGHDTYQEPIVDPTKDDPRKLFYIKDYRYRSYDLSSMSLAKMTISVLGLNDSDEKVFPRFLIGNKLIEELDMLYESAVELGDNIIINTRKRNRIINACSNLLKMCLRSSRFGATMATVLHESNEYNKLRDLLSQYDLWDDDIEKLHQESLSISLSKR